MRNSDKQLDFLGDLNLPNSGKSSLCVDLYRQISELAPGGFLSDQLICANIRAWSLYLCQSAYNVLRGALVTEKIPYNSVKYFNLELAIEQENVSKWMEDYKLSADSEENWGEFKSIKEFVSRCEMAEYIDQYINFYSFSERYLPDYARNESKSVFASEMEGQKKIYHSNQNQELRQTPSRNQQSIEGDRQTDPPGMFLAFIFSGFILGLVIGMSLMASACE